MLYCTYNNSHGYYHTDDQTDKNKSLGAHAIVERRKTLCVSFCFSGLGWQLDCEERRTHDRHQTSPRPPIATVSQTALTDSLHNVLRKPCRPCTPLKRLRTSSTALVRAAAPEPEPATTAVAAAAAAAAEEGEIDFGQRRRWRRKRRSTASAGRTTQRRKSGAKRR
jgi:hypothetical protein